MDTARTAEASEMSPPDGAGVKRAAWGGSQGCGWEHC